MVTNTKAHTVLPFLSSKKSIQFHPPEKLGPHSARHTEKSDIYSLGTVFYYLLTGQWPFKDEDLPKVTKLVLEGRLPELPEKVLNSTHLFDVSVVNVMRKCMAFDPNERPSAREVANYLHEALSKLLV